MGVSSDGILCFGHDLGEEVVGVVPWATEDDDDIDFEEWLYRIAGFTARHEAWARYEAWSAEHMPDLRYPQNMDAWEAADPEGRDALTAAYETQRKIVADCPIEIVNHCSYDYAMYIVAVRGTEVSASRGYAQKLDFSELNAKAVAGLAPATDFCREHAIPFDEPGWILASIYG